VYCSSSSAPASPVLPGSSPSCTPVRVELQLLFGSGALTRVAPVYTHESTQCLLPICGLCRRYRRPSTHVPVRRILPASTQIGKTGTHDREEPESACSLQAASDGIYSHEEDSLTPGASLTYKQRSCAQKRGIVRQECKPKSLSRRTFVALAS
jgi:hypothetical protein